MSFFWALLHSLQQEVNLATNWTCACMLAEQAIIIQARQGRRHPTNVLIFSCLPFVSLERKSLKKLINLQVIRILVSN